MNTFEKLNVIREPELENSASTRHTPHALRTTPQRSGPAPTLINPGYSLAVLAGMPSAAQFGMVAIGKKQAAIHALGS